MSSTDNTYVTWLHPMNVAVGDFYHDDRGHSAHCAWNAARQVGRTVGLPWAIIDQHHVVGTHPVLCWCCTRVQRWVPASCTR